MLMIGGKTLGNAWMIITRVMEMPFSLAISIYPDARTLMRQARLTRKTGARPAIANVVAGSVIA